MTNSSQNPSGNSAPLLWRPNVVMWCALLLTPVIGAWMISENWQQLGENKKAKSSRFWILLSLFVILIWVPYINSISPGYGWAAYIGIWAWWQYISVIPQVRFIKTTTAITDFHRSWLGPVFSSIGIQVAIVIILITVVDPRMNKIGKNSDGMCFVYRVKTVEDADKLIKCIDTKWFKINKQKLRELEVEIEKIGNIDLKLAQAKSEEEALAIFESHLDGIHEQYRKVWGFDLVLIQLFSIEGESLRNYVLRGIGAAAREQFKKEIPQLSTISDQEVASIILLQYSKMLMANVYSYIYNGSVETAAGRNQLSIWNVVLEKYISNDQQGNVSRDQKIAYIKSNSRYFSGLTTIRSIAPPPEEVAANVALPSLTQPAENVPTPTPPTVATNAAMSKAITGLVIICPGMELEAYCLQDNVGGKIIYVGVPSDYEGTLLGDNLYHNMQKKSFMTITGTVGEKMVSGTKRAAFLSIN